MNQHVKPMTLIKETDYGTPHPEVSETTKLVTLEIDGLEITVPEGTSIMNAAMQLGIDEFTRGKGRFMLTGFLPTTERTNRNFPLILTTGRILAHYNVGAQARRTANVAWHPEDVLELHPTPGLSGRRNGRSGNSRTSESQEKKAWSPRNSLGCQCVIS